MDILWDDNDLLAVGKPPGLSVHEAPGPGSSVLRELRLQHGFSGLTPVHRLDKDASGVLLLARTKDAASRLQKNWHSVTKIYLALCDGEFSAANSGLIDAPILEHQTGKPERLRNALRYYQEQHPGEVLPPLPAPKTSAVHPAGRTARTACRVLKTFRCPGGAFSWLEVAPQQGRMHQIRVHLKYAAHPLAVDPLYGTRAEFAPEAGGAATLKRLALHAWKLVLPRAVLFTAETEETAEIAIEAPLPHDLAATLAALNAESKFEKLVANA